MMLGGGSEIPQDRFVVLRQQSEAIRFILRPRANVGRGEIAHVVHVETEQRAHLRLSEQGFGFRQALSAQTIEVDPVFPIDRHGSMSFQCHNYLQLLASSCQLPAKSSSS